MTTNFNWDAYEPVKKEQNGTPTQQSSSKAASFNWDNYEGLPGYETREAPQKEEPMTFKENLDISMKEAFKGYGRLGLSGFSHIYTALPRAAGGILQGLAGIGEEGEPGQIKGAGTRMIRGAGEYLSKKGEEELAVNKERIQKILGKPYGKGEEKIQEFTDDFGDLVGLGIPPAHAAVGAGFSSVGDLFGASKETRETLKVIGTSIPALAKGVQLLWQDRNFVARFMDIFRKKPQAMGKLTGLSGTQLKAFNALSKAEQESFIKQMLDAESNIMNQAKEQQLAAGSGQKATRLGEEAIAGTEQAFADRMPSPEAARTLTGRVTEGGEDIGIKPTPNPRIRASSTDANLEKMLDNVNPNEIGNKRKAGINLKNTVMESDNAAYQTVNDLYTRSRELNSNINTPHMKLANQLQGRLTELKRIPRPSSVQRNLINALEDIVGELAVVEDGAIVGYRDINNQVLIDQIQSLRQTVDFDFEHGSPKGIFRPTINDIQESVYNVASESGNKAASDALREANTAYREWTTKYNNDYVNPYRDRSNQSYEQLLDKNLKSDHFNVVNNLVGETPQGSQILGATQREIVENKLKDFVKEPNLVRSRSFRKAMTELESVLTPKQMSAVRAEMEAQVPERFSRKATANKFKPMDTAKEIEKANTNIKAAAKYSNKTVAEIRKLSGTPEGIAQLKTDLAKTPNGEAIFEDLAKRKINSILSEGKIKAEFKGKDLYKVLNNEDNYALIEALTSPEDASMALDIAEKLANKKFTLENLSKISKSAAKYKLIHFLLF